MATGLTPGRGRPSWWVKSARSPITKISGRPGTVRSGSTTTRPFRSSGQPRKFPILRGGHTGGPQNGRGLEALGAADRDPRGVDLGHGSPGADLDAEADELGTRVLRRNSRVARQDSRAGLDENDASLARIDVPEVVDEDLSGDLGDGAGELDAGRAAAHDREGQQSASALEIGLPVGLLEGEKNAAADLERVLEALQPGRVGLPGLVSEVGVPGAGGDHETVVRQHPAVRERHLASHRVDRPGLGQDDVGVLLAAQDRADRIGDVGRRKRRGRHLVEERLEKVVIAPIDDRDADRGLREPPGRLEAAKTRANQDDVVDGVPGRRGR